LPGADPGANPTFLERASCPGGWRQLLESQLPRIPLSPPDASLGGAGNASDDTHINVLATNGGVVDLSQVAGITAGNAAFQAVNPGSQINLAGLTSFTGAVAGPNANVLDARQGGTITLASGTATVSSVLVRLDPTGTLTAGTLQLSGGSLLTGSGTINGDVDNAGQINPGTDGMPGFLTINGNYTQTANGVLNIRIGGNVAGTDYDQLVVSGSVSLDGTLNGS